MLLKYFLNIILGQGIPPCALILYMMRSPQRSAEERERYETGNMPYYFLRLLLLFSCLLFLRLVMLIYAVISIRRVNKT